MLVVDGKGIDKKKGLKVSGRNEEDLSGKIENYIGSTAYYSNVFCDNNFAGGWIHAIMVFF